MTHGTYPEYSFANQMAGLLKHGTAISHSRLFPGGSGNAKKALRDKGRYELHEDVIFAAIAQQRQIEDIAASSSAKARRSVTKRPTKPSREGHSTVQSIDLTNHNHSDDDTEYWDQ